MVAMTSETTPLSPDLNATHVELPSFCAHELFEQQVVRTPEALAIICNEQRLTYRELNERANRVAHCLRRRGAGPESRVGVAVQHSPAMLIGLLGVWKAGAAYVPLNPAYPPERLSFMARDAELHVLLCEQKFTGLFSNVAVETIFLDTDWPTIAGESYSNPPLLTSPANLAYVMHASGSGGQRKGTRIGHNGLVNYLCWAITAYGLDAGRPVPVRPSVSFDLTVTSLYPPLLVGSHVELLQQDTGAQSPIPEISTPAHEFVLPRTPVEQKLAAIWGTMLNLDQVGINDDVFDLGTQSLQAVKAVARIRAELDVDIQLRNIFEQPTIAGLAKVIENLAAGSKLHSQDARHRPADPCHSAHGANCIARDLAVLS